MPPIPCAYVGTEEECPKPKRKRFKDYLKEQLRTKENTEPIAGAKIKH